MDVTNYLLSGMILQVEMGHPVAQACANAADLRAAEEWYDFLLGKGGTLRFVPPKMDQNGWNPQSLPLIALKKRETCIQLQSTYWTPFNVSISGMLIFKRATIIVPLAKVAENQSLG